MYRKLICGFSVLISFLSLSVLSQTAFAVSASPNPSTTGDFTVSWSRSSIYNSYTLIESYEGGSATGLYTGSAGSFSLSNKINGSYYYEVLGERCVFVCYPVSLGSVTVTVSQISAPGTPGNISGPSSANYGTYTLSWAAASGTVTNYQLQERLNGGSWSTIQNTTSRSRSFNKNPDRYYDYRVRACNQGVCSSYTPNKRVTMPAASLTASANPTLLALTNESFSFTWASVMTTSCSGTGGSSATSGASSRIVGGWAYLNITNLWHSSITVTCDVIGGGTVSETIEMAASEVYQQQPPTVNVSWNVSSQLVGESATFSWGSTGAHTCTLDGETVESEGARAYTFSSDGTHTHTVECSNNQGLVSDSASVSVSYPALPSVSLNWSSATAEEGESTVLSWSSPGANSCTLDGQNVAVNGSNNISHTLYGEKNNTLICSNITGSSTAEASIMVLPSSTSTSDFPLAQNPANDLNGSTDFWGYLNGSFNVSPGGSASYSVPIEVPPGIRGMQPNVSLVYNSNANNGIAGWGWNISGLSRIHRCNANLIKDNNIAGVLDNDDAYKLCIDGQRLVETSSGEYRTERESYRKIVKSGSGFLVSLRDGREFEYGLTDDARREALTGSDYIDWRMNKVTDIATNYMTFHYEKDMTDGIHRIERIEYTKNSGVAGIDQTVEFNYEDRPDKTNNYWAGVYSQQDKRLQNIRVLAGGGLVRKYNLAYQAYDGSTYADPAQTSRLNEIKVCYDEYESICSEPLNFEWNQLAQSNLDFTPTSFISGLGEYSRLAYADFDADGVTEALVSERTGTVIDLYLLERGEALTRSAAQKRGSFDTGVTTTTSIAHNNDLNGDGRADIILARGVNDPYQVSYMQANGEFTTPVDFIDASEYNESPTFQFRDMNGDGFVDMFRANELYRPNPVKFEVAINDGQGNFGDFVEWGLQNGGQPNTIKLADMNGDGLTDVVRCDFQGSNCGFIVSLNNGDGFDDQAMWPGVVSELAWSRRNNPDGSSARVAQHMVLADVNGDRTADIVWASEDDVQVALNNGSSFESFKLWLDVDIAHDGWGSASSVWQKPAPFTLSDMNMDGRLDIIYRDLYENVFIAYNRGTYKNNGLVTALGFSSPRDLGVDSQNFLGMDTNADGATDISFGSPGTFSINGATYSGTGIAESSLSRHSITRINVNSENTIDLAYKPLTDTAVHTAHTTAAAGYSVAPFGNTVVVDDVVFDESSGESSRNISNVSRTRMVVSKVDVANGIGGINSSEYHYTGHLRHLSGWGSLGFSEVQIDNTINKTDGTTERSRTVSQYNQAATEQYNATGLLLAQAQYASQQNGSLQRIAQKTFQWHIQTFADDVDDDGYKSPHFALQRIESATDTYDLESGSFLANSKQISQNYNAAAPTQCSAITASVTAGSAAANGYDAYGNLAQSANISCQGSDTFISTSKTQFDNRTSGNDWLLGLPLNTQVTNSAPDANNVQQSLTREVERTFTTVGLPSTETREPNNTSLYRRTSFSNYDAYGTPQTITENWNSSAGLGITTRSSHINVSYQSDGTRTVTATNALEHTSTSVVDGRFGEATSFTDSNNLTTTSTFDALGRIATVTLPDSTTVSTVYKACNNCESEVPSAQFYIHQKATGASSERAYYDAFSRPIGQRSFGLLGEETFAVTEYDAAGRVYRTSNPFFANDTTRHYTESEYDSLGRPVNVTAPDNGETTTVYNGLQVTVTNDLLQTQTRWHNGIGQNVHTQDDNGTEITYAYDPFGNLTYTEIENVETHMGYDRIGRQLYLDDPSAGRTEYTYNGLDLMVTSTDAKNQRTAFTYDALGRQITRVDNATASNPASRTHQWFYDTPSSGEGRLDSVVGFDTDGASYQENYSYNAYGLPTELETVIKGSSYVTSTHYDDFNRPVAVEYPTGYTVVNNFNAQGYRHQVSELLSGDVLWTANQADAFGNITHSTHGNGVNTDSEFDAQTGRVNSIYAMGNNNLLVQNQDFYYDTLGNLLQRDDHRVLYSEAFCYDNLNRLVAARQNGCSSADQDITYDVLGNILTRDMQGQTNTYSYHNSSNPYQLSSASMGGSYGYDANGNITSRDGDGITYSAFDKPTRMTKDGNVVDIAYGANHQRVQRIDNNSGSATVTTTYVAGIYEKQEEGSNTKHIHYIGDIALHIWEEESNTLTDTKTRYLHLDHIGSIVAKTNEEADSVDDVEWMAYDAWGLRQDRSWMGAILGTGYVPTDTRKGFTGHEHLDGVGLIHMNGRVYDPTIGRFLSADPLVQAPTNTQSFNRYAYVWNNPLKMTDPTGFEGCDIQHNSCTVVRVSDGESTMILGPAKIESGDDEKTSDGESIEKPSRPNFGSGGDSTGQVDSSIAATGAGGDTSGFDEIQNPGDDIDPGGSSGGGQLLGAMPANVEISVGSGAFGSSGLGDITGALNSFQTGLDVAGLTPGVGIFADGLNAVIYAVRGDFVTSGISLLAMLPVMGQAATGAKLAKKASLAIGPKNSQKFVSSRAAMRAAKRDAGIPTSQTHITHTKNLKSDKLDTKRTATEFDFGSGRKIQLHPKGHSFSDGTSYSQPHFNNHGVGGTGGHYEF
ncbi:MAG: FG-GAP-like repeat-containing protein [Agarilytica sp.]